MHKIICLEIRTSFNSHTRNPEMKLLMKCQSMNSDDSILSSYVIGLDTNIVCYCPIHCKCNISLFFVVHLGSTIGRKNGKVVKRFPLTAFRQVSELFTKLYIYIHQNKERNVIIKCKF